VRLLISCRSSKQTPLQLTDPRFYAEMSKLWAFTCHCVAVSSARPSHLLQTRARSLSPSFKMWGTGISSFSPGKASVPPAIFSGTASTPLVPLTQKTATMLKGGNLLYKSA